MQAKPNQFFRVAGCSLHCVAALGLAVLFGSTPAKAQTPSSNLLFTVGTTIRDGTGTDWSYVLMGAPQSQLLAGKRFAIYSKPGTANNSAAFTLRGNISQSSDPAAINTLLNKSASLGQNLGTLQNVMMKLLHHYPAAANQALAQNVQLALQVSVTDPLAAQSLAAIAGANPGLELCLGRAFTEPITGVTTYEAREINPATGVAGDVVGRVTITPGAPTVMPAPGAPFQVVSNAPIDDLRIRLRWSQPDELLRLSLLSYGFNVWRIPLAAAHSAGYDVTPPATAQLFTDPNFTRANAGPIMATKYFANAADATDATTYFFRDDNGRAFGGTSFADGAQFYYFITARDVLGRDGLVSPGAIGQACRRLTPSAPTGVKVANTVQSGAQFLQITWQQNTNVTNQVTEYWVYRWPNPSMIFTNDNAPLSNRVGVVPQITNETANVFIDNGADAPATPGPMNYWYSVRSVSHGACGPLLSAPSAAVWGVLRERGAPAAVSNGVLYGSCGQPVVMFQQLNNLVNANGQDTRNWNYRLTCTRRDPGIAWTQFFVTNQDGTTETIGPLYFPPEDNTAQFDYSVPTNGTSFSLRVACIVGNYYGAVSASAKFTFTSPTGVNSRQEAVFNSGQLLATALNSTDPLLMAFHGGALSFVSPGSVTANPSGTVSLKFNSLTQTPALMQVLTNGAWADIGVISPDSNNVYWVSYPACLLGPLPPFRGAALNLPPGDCLQHVTRGADGGAVAPIYLRFGTTPGTHEFRVYRTVDDGPLALVSQGAVNYDPANQIVHMDDSMPASAARLGYFVQLLNEHGNGSPISLIGYRHIKPAKLPRPVLSQPQAAGDTNNPQVALSWFCPSTGVYRFAIKIARQDQQGSGKPTGLNSIHLKSLLLPPVKQNAGYLGLFSKKLLITHFDEDQLTQPIGTNFGPGPSFSLTVGITPNVPYTIAVAAVDEQENEGDLSIAQNFTWVPPILPENVPWPARPLPNVTHFDDPSTNAQRVAAILLGTNGVLDTQYPVGIRVGSLNQLTNNAFTLTINTTNFFAYGGVGPQIDANQLVFRRISSDPGKRGDSLFPIVVYRQQVANAQYPHPSGNLTQVTPLMEKIPQLDTSLRGSSEVFVPDLLIASGEEPAGFLTFQPPEYAISFLYLRDLQPVIHGASYQYYAVRLNNKHEISEVINAGQVQIP